MGYAARSNPRALEGKDRDSVGMARLIEAAKKLTTPRKFDRFLLAYHPEDRDGIRSIVRPYVEFDPDEIAREDAAISDYARRAAAYAKRPQIEGASID
jgi:hypothetical protein